MTAANSVTSSGLPSPADRSGPRPDTALPQVFGRYLLVQRVSRGGMGEIFLAKHGLSGFEKLCVIKKVLPNLAEDELFISRFIDEAQVAIKLQHVNIAQVFEVGRVGNEYFLAIEYVEGRDLRRTLTVLGQKGRRPPVDVALFIGRDVANGLAYAHRRTRTDGRSLQLVHCDISPPNVLVSFEGETKIIDFGIAKSALRAAEPDPKMGFGKFGYMAPEQLVRGGVVDHRTDIYAAGTVLYELLTGERLYELGDSPDYRALARMVVRGEHRLPSQFDPSLAPYDALVVRCLRPKPEERYQSAAELRDAIQHALVAVNPTISSDRIGAFVREVFADEMAAQRELAERIARLHLSDFRAELTTQSVATVSFALANMPLYAPPTGEVPRQGPHAVDGTIEVDDLSSMIVRGGDTAHVRSRRRRGWRILAALAATAAGGAVAVAVVGTGAGKPTAPVAAPAAIVAEAPPARIGGGGPIVRELEAAPPVADATAVITPLPEVATPDRPAVRAPTRRDRPRSERRSRAPAPEREARAAEPELDPDKVQAKFQAVLRDYRDFKQSYGARLEQEWADLATFAQYARSRDKLLQLDRKIDRFRARMKAEQ